MSGTRLGFTNILFQLMPPDNPMRQDNLHFHVTTWTQRGSGSKTCIKTQVCSKSPVSARGPLLSSTLTSYCRWETEPRGFRECTALSGRLGTEHRPGLGLPAGVDRLSLHGPHVATLGVGGQNPAATVSSRRA